MMNKEKAKKLADELMAKPPLERIEAQIELLFKGVVTLVLQHDELKARLDALEKKSKK